MKLIYSKTGKQVKLGDEVTLRSGETVEVERIVEPHKPASTGRVGVRGNSYSEYYPSVICAEWIEREDRQETQLQIDCRNTREILSELCPALKLDMTTTNQVYKLVKLTKISAFTTAKDFVIARRFMRAVENVDLA